MKLKTKHLAIIAITAILIVCLVKGIDSALLGSALAIIAGLGGYEIYQARHQK